MCNIVTKLAKLVVDTLLLTGPRLSATLTTVMSAISVMRSHAIENREATVAETPGEKQELARGGSP